ncbi:MAG: hypothetical protein OEY29_08845 [Gammaproteobacteria bacterium]|nr:hypothetical protein [Gammaproteobacteria bacterium]
MKIKVILLLAGFVTTSGSAYAGEFSNRFMPNDMNYALSQWTADDEWAAEVQYSFKYIFYNCILHNEKDLFGCDKNAKGKAHLYLKYTGEFDFYAGSRESGPVINRTSNIALQLRWDMQDSSKFIKYIEWYDIGFEHRSDGQVTDANLTDDDPLSATFGQYLAEIEYQNDNHEYFDTLSRGADYISLSFGGPLSESVNYSFKYKIYDSGEESNITWGELAGTDTDFADYDLLTFSLSKKISTGNKYAGNILTLTADYTAGRGGMDTDSIDISLIIPLKSEDGWDIPLLIRAHAGPMDRLSDYTRSRDSVGVGLAFSF